MGKFGWWVVPLLFKLKFPLLEMLTKSDISKGKQQEKEKERKGMEWIIISLSSSCLKSAGFNK